MRQRTAMHVAQVALRLFSERGYENTTVDDIAAEAQVSRASFYAPGRAASRTGGARAADQGRVDTGGRARTGRRRRQRSCGARPAGTVVNALQLVLEAYVTDGPGVAAEPILTAAVGSVNVDS